MTVKVGVNGFGRIGRDFVRQYFMNEVEEFELVAINASGDIDTLAHMLKYDTMYGKFDKEVEVLEDGFLIDGKEVKLVESRDPAKIPWKELGVELVVDSTGAFRDREGLEKHIEAGAEKVILTAPGTGVDRTIVMGVNEEDYNPETDKLISNASCTTNCLAPVAKVVDENFGIKKGLMTTIHSYTGDQRLLDNRHKDLRRARAAAENIVPTTTGAAKAVSLVLPQLEGKLNGFAVRVPVPTVSLVDVTFEVEKDVTAEEVNEAFKKASEGEMEGVLGYSEEPLVSSDYAGDERSSIVDAELTTVMDKNMLKVVAWYDNEWGYSERVIDLTKLVAKKW